MSRMKVSIKITDEKTWSDDIPLEFSPAEAYALYLELKNVFEPSTSSSVQFSPSYALGELKGINSRQWEEVIEFINKKYDLFFAANYLSYLGYNSDKAYEFFILNEQKPKEKDGN